MTQKEKQLLGIDISARITYGLLFNLNGKTYPLYKVYNDGSFLLGDEHSLINGDNAKPYLRPMSSMTEEEDERRCAFLDDIEGGVEDAIPNYIDWLNINHFDYRGLIPMGLALPAQEGMYN